MNKVKRFIETSGIYFIGSVLSKLISFVLIPLYTGKLSPEQFGMYDLVVTVISLLVPVTFFQIWDGMFRFSFDKQSSTEKYSIISNSFSIGALGLITYSMVYWIIFKVFLFDFAWLIFIYGLLIAVQYQYAFISRVFLRNKLFVLTGFLNSLLSAIINILLISVFNMGIESLYIASIIGSLIQSLIIEIVLKPFKHFNIRDIKIPIIIEMVKFSVPLCIATISYWLLSGYTKLAILQQLGAYENGLYAVANKFSSIITLFVSVFQYAWNEMSYLMAKDDNRINKYENTIHFIFKVVLLGSGIFMLFIKLVFPYLVDSTYQDALFLIPLSLIGVAANTLAGFLGTIFMTEKKTSYILWTTVVAATINIICVWIFTPIWGIQGAIGALCLAFMILAFIRILIIGKIFNIKLPWSYLIYFIILAIAVYMYFTVNSKLKLAFIIIILCFISVYSFRDILLALWRVFKKKVV